MPPPSHPRRRKPTAMTTVSATVRRFDVRLWCERLLFNPSYLWVLACPLLVVEAVVCALVIVKVPYTEIDWQAYMQQVDGFVNGTRDYAQLVGGTGPLVYPAGHLYIYTLLYFLTEKGTNVSLAQSVFALLYVANLVVVCRIYRKSEKIPPYVLFFVCCLSYRVHSIYLLRLFNDPIAVFLLYGAVLLFLNDRWLTGCFFYSLAVSVKMNIILYAPALYVLLVTRFRYARTLALIVWCALIQLLLGGPFLVAKPLSYVARSFDVSRQFLFQWTVNWRFIGAELFGNRYFHVFLLVAHCGALLWFAVRYWLRPRQSFFAALFRYQRPKVLTTNEILFAMFSANFIGVMFSRTLHYQFYVWYFHTLPYLLWQTPYSPVFRLCILGLIELCWNTYPSTTWSSALLHVCHATIFVGLCIEWNKKRLPFPIENVDACEQQNLLSSPPQSPTATEEETAAKKVR